MREGEPLHGAPKRRQGLATRRRHSQVPRRVPGRWPLQGKELRVRENNNTSIILLHSVDADGVWSVWSLIPLLLVVFFLVCACISFDGRLAMASEDKTIVGKCVQCAVSCDDLSESVLCRVCKTFVILCPSCVKHYSEHKWRVYCAEHILLAAGKEVAPDAAAAAEPVDAAPEVAAAEDADDSTPAQAEEQWAVPANDPGCPEQLNSFLSRFTTAQLESQLEEIARILAFFKLKQRKAGSRSKNRKANLHLQKRRLEDYLRGRLRAEAEARGEAPPAEPTPEELARDQKRVAPLPPRDPNQLTSFVPLLNV